MKIKHCVEKLLKIKRKREFLKSWTYIQIHFILNPNH